MKLFQFITTNNLIWYGLYLILKNTVISHMLVKINYLRDLKMYTAYNNNYKVRQNILMCIIVHF